MLSRGGQHIKRCGLSAGFGDHFAAGHVSVADEPLLFLYPRWFTFVSQQRRRLLNSRTSKRSISNHHTGTLPSRLKTNLLQHRRQSLAAPSRQRWLSTSSVPMLPNLDTQTEKSATATDPPSESTVKDASSAGLVGKSGNFDAFAGLNTEDEFLTDPLIEQPGPAALGLATLPQYQRDISEEPTSPDRPRFGLSPRDVRRKGRRDYWMKKVAVGGRESIYRQMKAMILSAGRRAQFRSKKATSPSKHEPYRRQMLVPEETIAVICGPSWTSAASENIWYVRLHNGCKVHVLPPAESVGHSRKVLLTGSEWVTGLVENRIKQTQKLQENGDALLDVQKPVVPIFPSLRALERDNLPAPRVRGVWTNSSISQTPASLDLINDNWKNILTVREFVEHVDGLTNSHPGSNEQSHSQSVAIKLLELFSKGKNRRFISTAALNKSMSFLLEQGYLEYARRLFILTTNERVLTIETFNLIFESAARAQNVPLFLETMRKMLRLRIPASPDTLLAYAEFLIRPASRTKMVKLMEEKGWLQEPAAMRRALKLTMQDVFAQHLIEGKSVNAFFKKTIKAFGCSYFPERLIKDMFHVTFRLKNVSAMQQLFRLCKMNGLPLTPSILSPLIALFPHDTFTAMYYALECLERSKNKLDKKTYDALFLNALKNRHYNICRVLWRYACMDGKATNNMKRELAFFLTQAVGKEGLTEQEKVWQTSVGKVIVGIDIQSPGFPLKQSLLKDIPIEFHDNPIAYLMGNSMPQGDERMRQRRAARAILKHDIDVGPWYRPTVPLANMLEAAAELDAQWKDVPRTRNWLMQNAIQVSVKLVGYGS
ncbi:hypothetical protein ASPCAL11070 [Aspergillus calidoustus]|uniref:Pentatricopeptide repeat domain-containing protein n=1 Tax=Aspergillus calidoustus TaxID=454130 RepID=A0A0U5CDQ1_ASPCI|nr:hypothetical protein ASPCAL11070 [Aspergillus calidoustus]